ncbi:hypothetical protein [Mucilaginibacter polytrichastri]|nr:hypothetical protein [Mucilaginibacter polytrichastri]
MKNFKKLIRLCGLISYMMLAVAGIALGGVATALGKNNRLFIDNEVKIELVEQKEETDNGYEQLKL